MARPHKVDDWLVHRIAEFFKYADEISQMPEFPKPRDGAALSIWLESPTSLDATPLPITNERVIPNSIGYVLCEINPAIRPRILRQIADALEAKSAKKRKSGKADDIAKIQEACRRATAKLKGLYKGDPATFREIAAEYRQLTGFGLDRRAEKAAGCSLRPEPTSHRKKLPRRK